LNEKLVQLALRAKSSEKILTKLKKDRFPKEKDFN
jgi:hypothetical protein